MNEQKEILKENKKQRAKKILDSAIIPKDRETVGKIASDLMQKTPESLDPIEIERSMQEKYIDNLISSVEAGKKKYIGSFFVAVLLKNERLFPNIFRNYFIPRKTCPTPNYDQSVYRYNAEAEAIEYIWTIPDRVTCYTFKYNMKIIVPEERQLLELILKFQDGSLRRLAKKFNKEEANSSLIIKN